jgi:aspartate racemase
MDRNDMQKWVPGLVGVAARTDQAYYQAIHAHGSRSLDGGLVVNCYVTSMFTVDFLSLIHMLRRGEREAIEMRLLRAAEALKASGADFLVVTANTFHAYLGAIRRNGILPVLDVVQSSCETAARLGFRSIGILSTSMTVRERLYQEAAARMGLATIVPPPDMMGELDRVIFEELISGLFTDAGIATIRGIIAQLADQGADCAFLACTDLTHVATRLLPSPIPLLDTTRLHALYAARSAEAGALYAGGAEQELGEALLR